MAKFDVYEPTMLQAYTLCPEKFRLRYVNLHPQGSSVALFKGLVGHHVLANPDEPLDEIFVAAVTNYRAGVLKPVFDLPFEEEWKIHEELATEIVHWRKFSAMRGIEILEREHRVEFDIDGHRILGTIDLIYKTPLTPHGMVCIGDYKFGRRQSDRQLDRNLQHALYWMGLTKQGYVVDHNAWIQMQDLIPYKSDGKKARKGEYRGQVIYPIKISTADVKYIERTTLSIIHAIENDVFFQTPYGIDAPCTMCEYANSFCPRFQVGRGGQYDADLTAMSQATREQALLSALEEE